MKKYVTYSFVLPILVLALAMTAFGQEQFGSIEGTVKDSAGAVVPNASVTITSFTGTAAAGGAPTTGTSTGFNRTVTTGSDGFFRVLNVPSGVYIVTTAPVSGFAAARYENVQVALGKATQLTIQVTPGQSEVVVDVGGSDQPVDTTSSEISTSIASDRIDLLPKGESFTSILKVIPGTRPEPLAGGFSIDGASGAENTFIIDGQEVTNYRNAGLNGNNNIPFGLVQEVQVKSSGFNAEYGGATGGVINVVTKGGNNEFRGDMGIQFEPSKLSGNPRPSLLRFTSGNVNTASYTQTVEYIEAPKAESLNTFPSFNLGGPILKDKVWFFGSYSPQTFESSVDTTFYTNAPAATRTVTDRQHYTAKTRYEYAFGRIDASPFSNLRLTGTYLWNPRIDEGTLPFGTISLGGVNPCVTFSTGVQCGNDVTRKRGGRQNSNNVTFQAVYTPMNWLVTSFRYSRGFLNEKLGNYNIPVGAPVRYLCLNGNVAPTNQWGPDACTQGVNDSPNDISVKDVSVRENYEGDVTLLFNGGGRHEVKSGYAHQTIFNDLQKSATTRIYLQYGFDLTQNFNWTTIAQPTEGAIGHGVLYRYGEQGQGSNLNQALYLQDKWQPFRRLTLNLGVRIEKEALPSFNGFDAPFSFGWSDKIAPRLGGSYDLFGNGKTKIFASYGKFFDRLKFKMAQGSFGGNFYRVDFFEIFPNSGPFRTAFTPQTILGNFSDVGGGACPTTGFIGSGLSRCQNDYRVASNLPGLDISEAGGVDADLRPFQQREFTVGAEHELSRNYVLKARYTNKKLIDTVEDAGAISETGSEIYITGNPGRGLHAQFLEQFGYAEPFATARRDYQAVEVVLDRRFADNYFFNMNYTYSRLRGNYSGLANSDEAGRSDPGVNRSFDLPMIGFTAAGGSDYGALATDRPHVFNAYGGYVHNWSSSNSTEFSAFQTFQSGTPQSTTVDFIVPMFLNGRGDLGRTPMFSQTDFNVTHKYQFGRDNRYGIAVNVNIINLLDQKTVTGRYNDLSNNSVFNRYGCADVIDDNDEPHVNYPCILNAFNRGDLYDDINAAIDNHINGKDARFGKDSSFQGARSVRFGFKFTF